MRTLISIITICALIIFTYVLLTPLPPHIVNSQPLTLNYLNQRICQLETRVDQLLTVRMNILVLSAAVSIVGTVSTIMLSWRKEMRECQITKK